jgi:hypothetical protein
MVETLPRLQLQLMRVLVLVFSGLENKESRHLRRQGTVGPIQPKEVDKELIAV